NNTQKRIARCACVDRPSRLPILDRADIPCERAMPKSHPVVVIALLSALFAALPTTSQAQSWPQRPVRFIVSQGPGSAQDIAARLFGDQLAKRWGQPVIIENKPGADGINAVNAFIGAGDPH